MIQTLGQETIISKLSDHKLHFEKLESEDFFVQLAKTNKRRKLQSAK